MKSARAWLFPVLIFLIFVAATGSLSEANAGGVDSTSNGAVFAGKYFRGRGDVEYLRLLDISRRMFAPDPEFQNLAMFYWPAFNDTIVNGFVEGPTWDAWWIQNSYGPTYCALPFLEEPYGTFLQNSQDLWFDQMGDGHRKGAAPPFDWVAPDGCLCDAARPGWIVYRQGDGRTGMHDWAMEFTAAGILMQAELLLIKRDSNATAKYLSKLERAANFIESRRNPTNNLFLAGPAANLLAPSFSGWQKPDGTYDKAYLTGVSVTYIAALDRLIELEKLSGHSDKAALYSQRRSSARDGLKLLTTDEGYLIRSMDPDGVRHGVFGAPKHGYFETTCNHDAICFRVVDETQSRRIYKKLASIPGLRPHDVCIPNYPSYDDMYEKPEGLWRFGEWVNGGHWSTCEARLIMAYYRLGQYEDARRSMNHIMKFVRTFRIDNPLTDFGAQPYQPNLPVNLVYDTLGIPAAMVRGLFEYLYTAEGLAIVPHIPPGITELEQHFPIRFGTKRLYLATSGSGPITKVKINGRTWNAYDAYSISLPYEKTPNDAVIQIALGDSEVKPFHPRKEDRPFAPAKTTLQITPAPNMTMNELPLRIGADSAGNNRFVGDIGRVRILNRALSIQEIAAHAAAPLSNVPNDYAVVGDWRFERLEAGAFRNGAGLELGAKAVGPVEIVDCPGGKAVRLSGNSYIEIPPHKNLDLDTACTLEAWISPKMDSGAGMRIIDKMHVGQSDGYLLDVPAKNTVRLIADCGILSKDNAIPGDQWTHVAATISSDGTERLYINGKLITSAPGQRTQSSLDSLTSRLDRMRGFHTQLVRSGLGQTYEAAHAQLAMDYLATTQNRFQMLQRGQLIRLSASSQRAADESYLQTTAKLCEGLEKVIASYKGSTDSVKMRILKCWATANGSTP